MAPPIKRVAMAIVVAAVAVLLWVVTIDGLIGYISGDASSGDFFGRRADRGFLIGGALFAFLFSYLLATMVRNLIPRTVGAYGNEQKGPRRQP
jgi:hypothetical protein